MGLTIGDVLFFSIAVFGSLTAAWAGAVLAAILFPERTHKASKDFEDHPWLTFLIGLVTLAPLVFLAAVLAQQPPFSALAIVLVLAILAVTVLGSGGVARLVARRVEEQGGAQSSYHAIAKGAALVVIAEFIPVFGWFLVFPYVLIASFGAGLKSLFRKRAVVQAPPATEAQ